MNPAAIVVGAATIRAIVEQESVSFGIDSLLGVVDPALIAAHHGWLSPNISIRSRAWCIFRIMPGWSRYTGTGC